MLTALLILVVVVAVLAIIGGVSMMMEGCFFSWYMGFHAVQAGCEILAHIVPAILQGIVEG